MYHQLYHSPSNDSLTLNKLEIQKEKKKIIATKNIKFWIKKKKKQRMKYLVLIITSMVFIVPFPLINPFFNSPNPYSINKSIT